MTKIVKRETDKNRKMIYFGAPLWELHEDTPKGELSGAINSIVGRYRTLLSLTKVDLSDDEKMLLSAIFSGSELHGKNLRMHLSNMTWGLEDSGLDGDLAYKGLYQKVEKANLLERMAMIEAIGL